MGCGGTVEETVYLTPHCVGKRWWRGEREEEVDCVPNGTQSSKNAAAIKT